MSVAVSIFLGVFLGWLISVLSTLLGGWLVFRTRRDDSFLRLKQVEGDAFNMEDEYAEKSSEGVVLESGGVEDEATRMMEDSIRTASAQMYEQMGKPFVDTEK